MGFGHGFIDLAPPHFIVAASVINNEFIVGGASGKRASVSHENAIRADFAFVTIKGLFVQDRGRLIPVDVLQLVQTVCAC